MTKNDERFESPDRYLGRAMPAHERNRKEADIVRRVQNRQVACVAHAAAVGRVIVGMRRAKRDHLRAGNPDCEQQNQDRPAMLAHQPTL